MGEGISGERIKELRESRWPRWTQGKLADRAGVARSLLSELESGKRRQVRTGTAAKIAKALGVTLNDLTDESIFQQVQTVSGWDLPSPEDFTPEQRRDVKNFALFVLAQKRQQKGLGGDSEQ